MRKKSFLHDGLSGTSLKFIALFLMTLDHIHYFFGFTGVIPDAFSMLGRLAAPLFLFCVVEGFAHTHDRRRYFLRMYALSVLMTGMMFIIARYFRREDGFFPQNGMMTTFTLLIIIWQGIDWLHNRRFARGILAIALPLIWPVGISAVLMRVPSGNAVVQVVLMSIVPTWNLSPDATISMLVMGILMYLLRNRRGVQVAVFAVATMVYEMVYKGMLISRMMPDFVPMQMVTMYYEWMGVFAAPLMLCYNGQRGRGLKRLFYAFYPAHVYTLYALSCVLYAVMGG